MRVSCWGFLFRYYFLCVVYEVLIATMSKHLTLEELKAQAITLGLSGNDIGRFVLRQQTYKREERAIEREREREEKEREEREKERQLERERGEREEREKKREFELAKLRLAKESAEAKPALLYHDSSVRGSKFPTFQEGEDIASYLTRFERIATLLKVKGSSLAVRLGSLLTGKAAELYSSLDTDTISDFTLLKQALLTGFDKTPERYRQDFRSNKI